MGVYERACHIGRSGSLLKARCWAMKLDKRFGLLTQEYRPASLARCLDWSRVAGRSRSLACSCLSRYSSSTSNVAACRVSAHLRTRRSDRKQFSPASLLSLTMLGYVMDLAPLRHAFGRDPLRRHHGPSSLRLLHARAPARIWKNISMVFTRRSAPWWRTSMWSHCASSCALRGRGARASPATCPPSPRTSAQTVSRSRSAVVWLRPTSCCRRSSRRRPPEASEHGLQGLPYLSHRGSRLLSAENIGERVGTLARTSRAASRGG